MRSENIYENNEKIFRLKEIFRSVYDRLQNFHEIVL